MEPTREHATYQTVHSYAKIYPNMTKLFVFNHPSKVRMKGYEARKKKMTTKDDFVDPMNHIHSLRRAKTRLRDLIITNEFNLFCTFTFAHDRQNVEHLKKQMSTWLNNQQFRTGKFKYVIVPEFHKDGVSIHFHALFKDYTGELLNTGHRTNKGRISYEIKSYKLGWSTAVKIGTDPEDIAKVGHYVGKYITKDMPQFDGKRRYWCSQGLERPRKVTNPIIFQEESEKFTDEYYVPNMTVYTSNEKVDLVGEIPNTQPLVIAKNKDAQPFSYFDTLPEYEEKHSISVDKEDNSQTSLNYDN